MLVLQRKVGESLVIGEDITVSVVSIEGSRVRLAISAPEQVPILRTELIHAAAANHDAAAQQACGDMALFDLLDDALPSMQNSCEQGHVQIKPKGGAK